MPNPSSPLFFAAAGELIGGVTGATGGGWYMWQRGQQEPAKRSRHEDAISAKEASEDEIDIAALRKKTQRAGLDPDQVIAGCQQLRDKQVTPAKCWKPSNGRRSLAVDPICHQLVQQSRLTERGRRETCLWTDEESTTSWRWRDSWMPSRTPLVPLRLCGRHQPVREGQVGARAINL